MKLGDSHHQPPRGGSQIRPAGLRSARTDGILVRLAAMVVLVLILAGILWLHLHTRQDQVAREKLADQQQEEQIRSLVARTSVVGGPADEGAERWMAELMTGNLRTSDFLLRVFTGTDYLVTARNDRAFARDVYYILTGSEPDKSWLDQSEVFFSRGGSRVTLLKSAPAIPAIGSPEGSVRSLSITASFPRIDKVTIGVATAEGTCKLDQVAARLMLYVDGQLHSSSLIAPADQTFHVDWDTRAETPGVHDIVVMLRSADGRGRVIERGAFTIPQVYAAIDGAVLPMTLVGHEQWFYLTPKTRDVLFNANLPSGDVSAELFSLNGDSLLACDNRGLSHETLRLRGENEQVYFARVKRGGGQPDITPVSYTVTVSEKSLRLPATGDVLAVRSLDETSGKVVAADAYGTIQTLALSGVQLIEYTARLSALDFKLPDGTIPGLYPAFDRGTTRYGLYLPAGTVLTAERGLSLFTEAQEGSAAGLEIVNNQESGMAVKLSAVTSFVPARSENKLVIRITGYDGSIRTYTIHILYGPHTGGYDAQTLLKFPPSYRSGLWLLHATHPAYVFEPFDTGIPWASFINVQDETNRSLIQANKVPASWVESDSPVYDGTAWKAALRPVIEHFSDPRNFLLPETVFQFERLDYNPAIHTVEGVKAILKGTFMALQADKYADIFIKAGVDAGISPYFLASRAIQEMGSTGESQLAHGILEGYEGYFNYFNIGSYPNPSVVNGQRINGALFAMYGNDPGEKQVTPDEKAVLIPWDTAEKSILGGAIFIAKRYVNPGQNTLYFQKFDVIPEGGLYTRQYAQNIQMAWAEGKRYYNAYNDIGLAGSPFVFRIPFYRDMPYETTPLPHA